MEHNVSMLEFICGLTADSVLAQGVMQLYASKVAERKVAGKVRKSTCSK